MALDFTSQWGAATWGAAQWGGDDNSVSTGVSATSGIGVHASATCVLIAAVTCLAGVGLHVATSGGDSVGSTSGIGIGATAIAKCQASATSGIGVHATASAGATAPCSATSGVGIHVASSGVAACSASSGIAIGGASGSNDCRAGIGIHASATCAMTAPCSATSGIGIKSLVPGHPQTVIIGAGPLITFTPGTPSILGPAQLVTIGTGPLIRFTPGMPSIAGGPTHLQVFIGNVDRTDYLIPQGIGLAKHGGGGGGGSASVGAGPVTITSATIGRAQATFDLYVNDNSGWKPFANQTVILQEFGKKLFAGCIKAVSWEPWQPLLAGNATPIYHCNCADKSSLCDGRVVLKDYLSGADAAATVLDVVQNFLNGEGVTTQGVDTSGALGTLGAAIVGNLQTVTQVFDAIATQTGATWWVDMDGVLHFLIITTAPAAPISLSVTSNNFRNAACTQTTIGYANKFYAKSNLKVVPSGGSGVAGAARSETYTFINKGGQPWQQKAFDLGLAPGYVALQLPISVLIAITINGSPVAIKPLSGGVQPGNAYYWFDGINTAGITWPENFLPAIGDVIVIQYIPIYQNATVNTGTPLTGTCGSGVVEGVIQVPNISDQGQLDAIAAAYQAKNGIIPYIFTFETDDQDLAVGQAIPFNVPSAIPASPTTIYVTGVTKRRASAGDFKLDGKNSSFWTTVEASTQQNLGNWLTTFERLIARTTYPLPLDRFESANFVLAPGASLAGGAQNVNPYIVQNTGQLYAAVGAAGVAPTGQDLLIDFLVNGVSVFGGDITKMLKIPAGSTSKQTASVFRSPGLFVFKGDLITVTAQYSVLSGSPTAAQSVTANVQWSF